MSTQQFGELVYEKQWVQAMNCGIRIIAFIDELQSMPEYELIKSLTKAPRINAITEDI
jgi:hypothetical protein